MPRTAALLAALLLVPACAPLTEDQRAGLDQEICRDILWAYQQDPAARFAEVRVTCVDQVITLEGRVADVPAARDADQIARAKARGATVNSKLNVQPK
jgi:osmotically-inducible protein OsmY